jgi:hypothetical protein
MVLNFCVSEMENSKYFNPLIINKKKHNGMNYIKLLLINIIIRLCKLLPKYRKMDKMDVSHVSKVIFYHLH